MLIYRKFLSAFSAARESVMVSTRNASNLKKCQCKCQHSDVENLRKIFGEVTLSVRNTFTQIKTVATDGVVAATIVAMGAVTGTVVTAIEAG